MDIGTIQCLHVGSLGDMYHPLLRTATATATVLIIRDDSNPKKNKHRQFSIIKSRPAFSEPRLSSSSRRPLTGIDGSSWNQSFLSGSCSFKGPGLTKTEKREAPWLPSSLLPHIHAPPRHSSSSSSNYRASRPLWSSGELTTLSLVDLIHQRAWFSTKILRLNGREEEVGVEELLLGLATWSRAGSKELVTGAPDPVRPSAPFRLVGPCST
jgi:hypothetical protein